jgi:hypothetical protein
LIDIQDPPAIYDVEYTKPVVKVTLPLDRVQEVCGGLGVTVARKGQVIFGCSVRRDDACFVVVPIIDSYRIEKQDQERIWRHERAHCNGWPSDHPR